MGMDGFNGETQPIKAFIATSHGISNGYARTIYMLAYYISSTGLHPPATHHGHQEIAAKLE